MNENYIKNIFKNSPRTVLYVEYFPRFSPNIHTVPSVPKIEKVIAKLKIIKAFIQSKYCSPYKNKTIHFLKMNIKIMKPKQIASN